MCEYGYVRVSTKEQNDARQRLAMLEFGIPEENIILDKQSGKDFDRPGLIGLIHKLQQGDVLVIKSIDRLGRNYEEILALWRYLNKERGISIVVLDMPLLDTRGDHDLTGVLIADIVLQLLSYVAETEREFIHQRQAEGILAAKQRGVKFGRRPKKKPTQFGELKQQWENGEISARKAASILGISHSTFLRWVNPPHTNEFSVKK